MVRSSAGDRKREASVVKLAIVIEDTSTQPIAPQIGDSLQRSLWAKNAGRTHGGFAGDEVVEHEPGTVVREFQALIGGQQKRLRVDQMRRVPHQDSPLVERLVDKM